MHTEKGLGELGAQPVRICDVRVGFFGRIGAIGLTRKQTGNFEPPDGDLVEAMHREVEPVRPTARIDGHCKSQCKILSLMIIINNNSNYRKPRHRILIFVVWSL